MRTLLVALGLIMTLSTVAHADSWVRGYTRSDGTYVQPHYRSNPDGNVWNNYSTQGNTNPYTFKQGTVDPYAPSNNFGLGTLGSKKRYGW